MQCVFYAPCLEWAADERCPSTSPHLPHLDQIPLRNGNELIQMWLPQHSHNLTVISLHLKHNIKQKAGKISTIAPEFSCHISIRGGKFHLGHLCLGLQMSWKTLTNVVGFSWPIWKSKLFIAVCTEVQYCLQVVSSRLHIENYDWT